MPSNILLEANNIVSGDRMEENGHPRPNLERTAGMWAAAFGWSVTPEQVALAQILFKVARQVDHPRKENLIDIAGYSRVIEMCE